METNRLAENDVSKRVVMFNQGMPVTNVKLYSIIRGEQIKTFLTKNKLKRKSKEIN